MEAIRSDQPLGDSAAGGEAVHTGEGELMRARGRGPKLLLDAAGEMRWLPSSWSNPIAFRSLTPSRRAAEFSLEHPLFQTFPPLFQT